MESYFSTLPLEVVVDLLSFLDYRSVALFASVTKNQKYYFEKQDGLWKRIVCKLYHWGAKELNKVQKGTNIDWAKEYRVSAYYDHQIKNNQIYADPSQTQFKYFSVIDEDSKHYRFEHQVQENVGIPFFYFNVQSKLPLYPLPIGNFSVAYYEVEVLEGIEISYLYVGAALDGFVNGLPGVGRNSYAYGVYDGRIVLENDFGVSCAPECVTGDIAGFGIDFARNSIFFTKNGKVVAEATKTPVDTPLINLKSLHATVGFCETKECKVNLGTAPFKFDILKYQQEKAKTKLYSTTRLYSDVLREHLTACSEFETRVVIDSWPTTYAPMDYNPPPPDARMNPFLYMLLYLRLPPNFVPSSDFSIEEDGLLNALIATQHCRAITHSFSMLPSLENDNNGRSIIDYIAQSLEAPEQKDRPFKDYCDEVMYRAVTTLGQTIAAMVAACKDDLLKEFGTFFAPKALSFLLMGYWDNAHYITQLAAREFYEPTETETPMDNNEVFSEEKIQEIYSTAIHRMMYLRRAAIAFSASEKYRIKYAPQKEKQKTEAMRVYGIDKQLESLFNASIKQLIHLGANQHVPAFSGVILGFIADAKAGFTDRLIVYGMFAYQWKPEDITTSKEEFVNKILVRLNELATDEMKLEFLQHYVKVWSQIQEMQDVNSALFLLQGVFGYKKKKTRKGDIQALMDDMEKFMHTKLKEYERKIEEKKRVAALAWHNKLSSTKVIIGASVVVAAVTLLSTLLYTRKKTK